MSRRPRPMLLPRHGPITFPHPESADDEGLLAIGGDLSPERLLFAYQQGIFPWFSEGTPPLWWSPNPRAVIDDRSLHVSRSLNRELDRGRFRVTCNAAFKTVMLECGREREGGTWILPEMVSAYATLHRLGHGLSFEVWRGERLVGGLYGVLTGALFAAESMFHREPNASKVALVTSVRALFAAGVQLFDVQFLTDHLASMGAYEIPRAEYLTRLVPTREAAVSPANVLASAADA